MRKLEKVSVKGFRSIRSLEDFTLGQITVLIGANGSGKSNLITFFRMMNHVTQGGLQKFLQMGGGASNFLHFGPGRTRFIGIKMEFTDDAASNSYSSELTFAAVDRLIFVSEQLEYRRRQADRPQVLPMENHEPSESCLSRYLAPELRTERFCKHFLDKTRVFHFHDTSMTSRMRNYCEAEDNSWLRAEGGNLPAVLLRLREEFPDCYRRVVDGVNTVFPELKDFHLEPQTTNGRGLLLRWIPLSAPAETFGPSHLSDGTLRIIALVTLLNLPPEMTPLMIILDEPELGLHPAAEAYLAGLIRAASHRYQVLLSTQSAGFVDHFQPEELVIVSMEDGASSFSRLEPDALRGWLQRYSLGEAWKKNLLGGRPQ